MLKQSSSTASLESHLEFAARRCKNSKNHNQQFGCGLKAQLFDTI